MILLCLYLCVSVPLCRVASFLGTLTKRSMGILPMSITGVPPVQIPKNMAKMAMRLTGETPVLRCFVRSPYSAIWLNVRSMSRSWLRDQAM
jgi:hypothetical protein